MPEFLEGFEEALKQFLGFVDSLGSPEMLGGELGAFDQSLRQVGLEPLSETIDLAGRLAPVFDGVAAGVGIERSLVDAGVLDPDPLNFATKSDLVATLDKKLTGLTDSSVRIEETDLILDFKDIGQTIVPFDTDMKIDGYTFPEAVKLEVIPSFSFDFTLGFDLTKQDASGFFISIDDLDFATSATLETSDFGISIGSIPTPIDVKGAALTLDAGLGIGFDKDGDPNTVDRLSLADFGSALAGDPASAARVDIATRGASLSGILPLSVPGFPLSSAEPVVIINDDDLFDGDVPFEAGFDVRITDRDAFLGDLRGLFAGIDDPFLDFPTPALPFVGDVLDDLNVADDVGQAFVGVVERALPADEQPVLLGRVLAGAIDRGIGELLGSVGTLDNTGRTLDRQGDAIEYTLMISGGTTNDVPLDFLGALPGLGLTIRGEGDIGLALAYSLDFGVGFSLEDGLYIRTDQLDGTPGGPEFQFGLRANLEDAGFAASLGFLDLQVTDQLRDERWSGLLEEAFGTDLAGEIAATLAALSVRRGAPFDLDQLGSGVLGRFTLDLVDRGQGDSNDGRLTLAEVTGPSPDDGDTPATIAVLDARLLAAATLGATLDIGPNGRFPSFSTTILLRQPFDLARADEFGAFGAAPVVEFKGVSINLGGFVNDIAGAVLSKVEPLIEPLQPVLDVPNKRIPFISDLVGENITLLSLLEKAPASAVPEKTFEFLGVAAQVARLLDRLPQSDGSKPVVMFRVIDEIRVAGPDTGIDLRPGHEALATVQLPNPGRSGEVVLDPDDPDAPAHGRALVEFVDALRSLKGLNLPILDDPAAALGLLVGKDVKLLEYNVPDFKFRTNNITFLDIPVLGLTIPNPFGRDPRIGLFAKLEGNIAAATDFDLGFDTEGLRLFQQTRDPAQLLDGFFIDDHPGSRSGELEVSARLTAKAELEARAEIFGFGVRFRGSADGNVDGIVSADLEDLNGDGKVRASEFDELISRGIFDFDGRIDVSLVGRLSGSISIRFARDPSESVSVTLGPRELVAFG